MKIKRRVEIYVNVNEVWKQSTKSLKPLARVEQYLKLFFKLLNHFVKRTAIGESFQFTHALSVFSDHKLKRVATELLVGLFWLNRSPGMAFNKLTFLRIYFCVNNLRQRQTEKDEWHRQKLWLNVVSSDSIRNIWVRTEQQNVLRLIAMCPLI